MPVPMEVAYEQHPIKKTPNRTTGILLSNRVYLLPLLLANLAISLDYTELQAQLVAKLTSFIPHHPAIFLS
ncbi:hypothetical protein [Bacillus sp. LL01]|uniref:hypothetical protein n=1 Tax=Bacillus sp. LL01 TaxID=1665556 RepID=UPI0018E304A5|nr:hypothetical protein [Bacillus sp. LL01]